MSKVYNYIIVSVGLVLLLQYAGLPTGASLFWLGVTNGDISNVSAGQFYLAIMGLFTLGVGATIVIGYFTKSSSESYIVAPIAGGLFTVITSTLIAITVYTKDMGWIHYISNLLFIPLLIGLGIAVINFWRGTD